MATANKLSAAHLDAIAYRFALNAKCTEIRVDLEQGIRTDAGAALVGVDVSDGTVWHHTKTPAGIDRIDAWRRKLFGDIERFPLAHAGEQIRMLGALIATLRARLDGATNPQLPALAREYREAVMAARSIAESLRPQAVRESVVHHVGADERRALIARVSGLHREATEAGVLELPAGNGDEPAAKE